MLTWLAHLCYTLTQNSPAPFINLAAAADQVVSVTICVENFHAVYTKKVATITIVTQSIQFKDFLAFVTI